MPRNPIQESTPEGMQQKGSMQVSGTAPETISVEEGRANTQKLLAGGGVVGSVVKKTRVDVPPIKHYIVTKTGTAVQSGVRVTLNEGKVVTPQQYDIKQLIRSGVKLRELAEDEV